MTSQQINNKQELYEIYKKIEEKVLSLDDREMKSLQRAMEYFCSAWDILERMKNTLLLTMEDEYNHGYEQELERWYNLLALLQGKEIKS